MEPPHLMKPGTTTQKNRGDQSQPWANSKAQAQQSQPARAWNWVGLGHGDLEIFRATPTVDKA